VDPSDVPETRLFVAAHPLQEGNEGHEAIIVLWLAQFLHQILGLLLVQLLTEVGQKTEKLIADHGVVVIFVIKLQDLNEVVESTLILGVLCCLVDGVDIGLLEHLLALFLLTTDLIDGLQGWVEVAGAHKVTSVEGVDIAVTLEIVDVEGEVDGLDLLFLKTKFSHCGVVFSSLLSHYC